MTKDDAIKIAKDVLDYNPETGVLTWSKVSNRTDRFGMEAGWLDGTKGYRKIEIKGFSFRAHRICWLLAYGEYPKDEIDHINGIKNDNRLINLRQATHSQNCMNQKIKVNNKTGFKGVHLRKGTKKYVSIIWKNGKCHYLGQYDAPKQAHDAYVKASVVIHGEFANHGEFSTI